MHVFRRSKLLSGVAVLVIISMASTGCRSSCGNRCCMQHYGDPCCGEGMVASADPPFSNHVSGASYASLGTPIASGSNCRVCPPSSQGNQLASLGTPVASNCCRPGFPSRPLWRLSPTRSEPKAMPSPHYAANQSRYQGQQYVNCRNCVPNAGSHVAIQTQSPSQFRQVTCSDCSTSQQPLQTQTALMLRPVPAGQNRSTTHDTWSPVRRVSNEAPPLADLGVHQANSAAVELPGMILPAIPAMNESLASTSSLPQLPPLLVAQADTSNDEPPMPKSMPGANNRNNQLPPPRLRNSDKKNSTQTSNGWPDIPAPAITNPPHAPREFQKHALSAYVIEPPDVLRIDASTTVAGTRQLPIEGPHLVRPDGTIGLGTFGAVFVAGMTIDQAKMQIIDAIMRGVSQGQGQGRESEEDRDDKRDPPTLQDYWQAIRVDVAAFNSKYYYVITDGGGYGETVVRVPCTGNETVLDAISQIQGLPAVASKKKIWVARATPHDHHHPMILPVDWYGITQRGSAATNYQVFPGDRVYVNSDCRIRVDSHLAKILSPIERLFGVTLLGATTVNAIKGNQFGF